MENTNFWVDKRMRSVLKKLRNFINSIEETKLNDIKELIRIDISGVSVEPDDLTKIKNVLNETEFHTLRKILKYQ